MYWPLSLVGMSLCNYRALDIDEKFVIDWKRAATQGITTHPTSVGKVSAYKGKN